MQGENFSPRFGQVPIKFGFLLFEPSVIIAFEVEFFGPLGGGVDYFKHVNRAGRHDLHDGENEVHVAGYLTDLLSERALDFVRRQASAKRPFLLSLHYTAPHWPWETRDDVASAERIAQAIAHTDGGSIATY